MLVQCSLPTSPRWKGALRELHFSPKNTTEWASQGVKFPNMIPLWLLRHSLLLSHDHTSCALEHYWKNFCSWLPTLRHAGCCPDGCIRMRLCWCCFKSINHSGYQPMRRKYFATCMNLDTQQKYISLFCHMHESTYVQEKNISRFTHSMKCKKRKTSLFNCWFRNSFLKQFNLPLYHFLGHENS